MTIDPRLLLTNLRPAGVLLALLVSITWIYMTAVFGAALWRVG
jgi:ABC-type uncharacterized transport system permease subunit